MAEKRMCNGSNEERDLESFPDLSIDNHTFDQHIGSRHESTSDGQGQSTPVLSQVRTVEGQVLSTQNFGIENVGFIRIQRRPTSDESAYFMNVLPVPALDCYAGTPPPSVKVGKFVKHSQFCSLKSRLQSFLHHKWQLRKPSASTLASAGLFYLGTFQEKGETIIDQVYCYKCGESLRQWDEDDEPLREHRRFHPHCFQETWITDDGH